ncbi:MAG: mandelate racemase/muconate lactonizing enzyme family protein [SAR202 cluster bacterium]|jgi:L-alanine-DL-glutamate epimerase-like enolase superfamily enzyme|nr:mandelate racemase/muconate lactonizing enzyme family protein [SAR202 cluster bacterium]MDP6301042.1 mandelate racemase/muconate lactonizing enzyme family protein [SAR202 cluster bacterium]MDP7104500.1 mandelate racemase/muconate lactonizing enzyme family protein [SAR202 cluster bacterium]MDP7226163.1 mandelate racemase/muconate lactonizing enzyme family protein [SAR202 cluster bacterium]HJO81043.1 mandelate racemase/muconate lactonizing enzyme family protein [SAR202 cluster bacterium]|tara:strand:+ start:534 stop:1700 length:1167 start_codon:yes stop_codon:yes gene_type:complete
MKITDVETFVVDGGRRPWLFSAVRTDEGITGYGEFGSGVAAHALVGLIEDLKPLVVGKDPEAVEKLYFDMYRTLRQAPGGLTQMGIAGIELACWDIKGKAMGVPVNNLLGGPYRDKQRVYWSHLASARANRPELAPDKPLRDWDAVAAAAQEAPARGYDAFKTNILWPGDPPRGITQGRDGLNHDQRADTELVRHVEKQVSVMREAVGPDVDILLDINYHFKTEGAIRIARALEPYGLFWIEHDNEDPEALAQLKASTTTMLCSGEQHFTMREYLPYFELRAMDTVMVDVQWQGFGASKKVADLAEAYELNIAPHNPASELASFQSVQLCAAVSNVRIMESDPEGVPWRFELFTERPEVIDSYMTVPMAPGWGCDLVEDAAKKYAWNG